LIYKNKKKGRGVIMLYAVIIILILIIIGISGNLENEKKKLKQSYEEQISRNREVNLNLEKKISHLKNFNSDLEKNIKNLKSETFDLNSKIHSLKIKINQSLNPDEIMIEKLKDEIKFLKEDKENIEQYIQSYKNTYLDIEEKKLIIEKLEKQEETQNRKIKKLKEIFKSIQNSIDSFHNNGYIANNLNNEIISIFPNTELKLHYMDVKELNKLFRENQKDIQKVLDAYENRYTTKANKNIYHLMVVALQAELQNVLYNLKFEKLEKGIEDIKAITQKYLKLAETGNQTIVNTLINFIGQIEYLFINAVKIEYNYYVKKEQARQEQLAIKQQMREEAEERRLLKLQQEKIESEELKYKQELERTKNLLKDTNNNEEIEQLNKRILELQAQLSDVVIKKDEIINLQNGKAGNVYIISNLGSFGANIFKIGMTRRIDPQERVNELGSASVPFKFDVHSFIFSEDAVNLENKLHQALNNKRVNKVNLRKEFFYCNIDELEELVYSIDPTAEFNKTMLAEEYNQSLSTNENYIVNQNFEDDLAEDELND
jgi:phage protein